MPADATPRLTEDETRELIGRAQAGDVGAEPRRCGRPFNPLCPCARCGTLRGKVARGRPIRLSGRRFGLDGYLCDGCYKSLSRVELTALKCCDCHTEEGYRRAGNSLPSRYDGRRFGRDGRLCHQCFVEACRVERESKVEIAPAVIVSCSNCGRNDDRAPVGRKRPRRFSGERFGIDGVLCQACYRKFSYAAYLADIFLGEGPEGNGDLEDEALDDRGNRVPRYLPSSGQIAEAVAELRREKGMVDVEPWEDCPRIAARGRQVVVV